MVEGRAVVQRVLSRNTEPHNRKMRQQCALVATKMSTLRLHQQDSCQPGKGRDYSPLFIISETIPGKLSLGLSSQYSAQGEAGQSLGQHSIG